MSSTLNSHDNSPRAALAAGTIQRWPVVAARALDVVLPPNNDVPHLASFCRAYLARTARSHKTLPTERIGQKLDLRCRASAGKSPVMHDVKTMESLNIYPATWAISVLAPLRPRPQSGVSVDNWRHACAFQRQGRSVH